MILSVAQGKEPQLDCICFSSWKEISGGKGLRNNRLVFQMPDMSHEQNPFSLHFVIPPGGDERRKKEGSAASLNTALLIAVP